MKIKLLFLDLMAFGFSNGQNIFRDDFSSYTINSQLNGQGLWTNNSTLPNVGIGNCVNPSAGVICENAKILNQSLSFLDYGTSTKSVEIAPIKDGVARPITPIINSGNFYISMVINLVTVPSVSNDFIRIYNFPGVPEVCFRMLVQQDGFGYKIGVRKGSSGNATVFSTTTFNIGENVLVILKYSHLPGNNDDELKLYANPNYSAGEPLTTTATTISGLDQSGFVGSFVFRQNFNNNMPFGFASLVSVARTWADLGFIPLAINQFDNNNINIFANNNNTLTINSNSTLNNVKLNLYTITGTLIEKQNINLIANNNQIKINPLNNNSIYIAELIDENGNKYTKKITLN